MAYLKNIETGAVTDWLAEEAAEYLTLSRIRTTSAIQVPGTGGFGAGSGSGYQDVAANTPIWQAVAFEDTGWPDPAGGRVQILYLGGTTGNKLETSQAQNTPPVVGEITGAFWVPFAEYSGSGTNYRTLELYQWRHKEKVKTEEPPAEKAKLASLSLKEKVAPAFVPVKMTVEASAEIKAGVASGNIEPLMASSTSTAGSSVDPGGLLYVVYKRV